jgi:glucose/arabinose dehydrogenase
MKNSNRKQFVLALLFILILSSAVILFTLRASLLGQTESQYSVDLAFPNLTFNQPVGIFSPSDESNRLFLIEQIGVIRVFDNTRTASESSVFLDVTSKVLFGGEQGLLGLAFHPNYEANGYFYVNYVTPNPTRTIIARYSVSPNNPYQAIMNSELILLVVNQPFSNHNGGQIAFGPDGYLYIGLGDGGSGGDPFGNGQNRSTLLGKILRINVDSPSQELNYSIPLDNPYFGTTLGHREEIYAYGFRNPWRFSFDNQNGQLWVGDVGQGQREEINIVEKGKNYGWNIMEGSVAYSGEDQTGLELPVWDYPRSEGIAVIGGYVYYGSTLPGLHSKYIYGDFGSGKIWALQYDGVNPPENTLLVNSDLSISSFGLDNQNMLYICSLNGRIYVLRSSVVASPSPSATSIPTQIPTTVTPTPTSSPTSSSTPSQSPDASLTPQKTAEPSGSEFSNYLILIIVTVFVAAAVIIILLTRKKNVNSTRI